MESETSSPNLLCEEDESSLTAPCNDKDENLDFCSVSESDCEFIQMLFQNEKNFQSYRIDFPGSERSWLKCVRSDAIKWILETRALFGYQYRTAYLSVIYFDRFFTRMWISGRKLWPFRILSVACLSLAAKMDECEIPSLTEYYVEGYKFQGYAIQRMELLVLNALDWKMTNVTPFAYLNYFANKLCGELRHKELLARAAGLILEIMNEINVTEHRLSIIAAAAVLAAADYHLTKTILVKKMEAIPSWGSVEKEKTFSCYATLKKILKLRTPTSLSTGVVDDSSKRRLTFDDGDQHLKILRSQ